MFSDWKNQVFCNFFLNTCLRSSDNLSFYVRYSIKKIYEMD